MTDHAQDGEHDQILREMNDALLASSVRQQELTEKAQLAEARLALMLAELQHRVRNILTVVRSVARRTAENREDIDDYVRHLDGRLAALARVQTILTRDPNQGVDLHNLVLNEIKSQVGMSDNHKISGPDVELSPKVAEVLSLAIHELATNSTKYGVLGKLRGTIRICWAVNDRDGRDWLHFTWNEPVHRKIERPVRTGFGSELITNRVPYELRGTGNIQIGDDEVEAEIAFPLANGASKLESAPAEQDMGSD